VNGSSYAGGGLGEPAYNGVPVYANVYTPARKVYSPPAGRQPYIMAGGYPALPPPSAAATAAGAASPAASPPAVAQFEEPAEEIWRPFSRNTGGAAAYSLPPPLSPSASFSQLSGQSGPPTALPPTPELLAEHEAALAAAASPRAGNGRAAAAPFGSLAVRTKRAATRGVSAMGAPGGQAAARDAAGGTPRPTFGGLPASDDSAKAFSPKANSRLRLRYGSSCAQPQRAAVSTSNAFPSNMLPSCSPQALLQFCCQHAHVRTTILQGTHAWMKPITHPPCSSLPPVAGAEAASAVAEKLHAQRFFDAAPPADAPPSFPTLKWAPSSSSSDQESPPPRERQEAPRQPNLVDL